MKVFRHHQIVAEYPPSSRFRIEGDDLVIVDAGDREVARHKAGTWHAVNAVCGYGTDSPTTGCPRCHGDAKQVPQRRSAGTKAK